MIITDKYWFSTMTANIGIIIGFDEITKERKAYIGTCKGLNEDLDADYIARNGSRIPKDLLTEIDNRLKN